MTKVIVVEDQTIMRDLLVRLLSQMSLVQVVGEAGDGQEALRLLEGPDFDLAIIDLGLPGLHGLDLLERIKHRPHPPKTLIFSATSAPETVRKALEIGVDGYIDKNSSLEETEKAIQQVLSGRNYFSARVVETMRELMMGHHPRGGESLSTREREIVKLIAESHSSKEIASLLNISVKTVETHRVNIMRQLDLHDVAALTRYAIAKGWVDPRGK